MDKTIKKATIGLYILCSTLSYLSLYLTANTKLKAGSIFIIVMAMLAICIRGQLKDYEIMGKLTLQYLLFLLIISVITSIIWLINLEDISYIFRGFSKLSFQLVVVLAAAGAVYLFGSKAIDYTCDSLLIYNFITIFLSWKKMGTAAMVADIQTFIATKGDAVGFMKLLELHDSTFATGLFIIYYLFFDKHDKKNIFRLILLVFFFMTGYKRIGIIALIIVCVLSPLLKKSKPSSRVILGVLLVCIGFVYILMVRFEIFEQVMNSAGINTMGRNDLYDFIKTYYEINPLFLGHGYEFITVLFKTATLGTLNMQKIGALHNGFLTQYIEFGFWGFFIWESFWFVYLMKKTEALGEDVQRLYLFLTVYMYVTYFTDNTAFCFYTGLAYRLIVLTMCQKVQERENDE